MQSGKQSV